MFFFPHRGQDTSPSVDLLELALTINGIFGHIMSVSLLK